MHLNTVVANLPLPYPLPEGQRMALSFITEGHFSSLTTVRGEGSLSDWQELRPESDMALSGDAAHLHLEQGASLGLRSCLVFLS